MGNIFINLNKLSSTDGGSHEHKHQTSNVINRSSQVSRNEWMWKKQWSSPVQYDTELIQLTVYNHVFGTFSCRVTYNGNVPFHWNQTHDFDIAVFSYDPVNRNTKISIFEFLTIDEKWYFSHSQLCFIFTASLQSLDADLPMGVNLSTTRRAVRKGTGGSLASFLECRLLN